MSQDAIIATARLTRHEMMYCPSAEALALLIEERCGLHPDRLPPDIDYIQAIDDETRSFTYTFFRVEP